MKLKSLFLIVFLAMTGGRLFAQGVRFEAPPVQQVANVGGNANVVTIPTQATINFCTFPANGVPCTNKATTYTASNLQTSCATSTQIVLAGTTNCVGFPDVRGNWGVWVPSGQYSYTLSVNGANFGPYGISLSATTASVTQGPTSAMGLPCSPGAQYNTSDGNGAFLCDPTGTIWNSIVGNGAQSPVGSPNPFIFNTDMRLRGPNPNGVDIRAFNGRAVNSNAVPLTTGTISSGLSSLSVASASGFVVNTGVAVAGAGASQAMTTPAAPTVTPSCAATWTGIGLTVPAGAGATPYQYQISMRDIGQGYTAASTAGTTSTGNASLGPSTMNITSIAAGTGQQKTALVDSTANVAVGCVVLIFGTTDDGEFGGVQIIDGVPDGTHFTYTSGVDVARGISTATATGGTAKYFLCNHIVLPTPGAGGIQYWVYGRAAGSMAYMGNSVIANLGYTDVSYNTFDDYGATMMASPITAWFIPTTPPGSPQNDTLFTTITNISGTTFTLADNAINTATSQNVRFANDKPILTAQTAVGFGAGGGGAIRFPASEDGLNDFCYATSGYLQLSTKSVIVDAPLCLGDTLELTSTNLFGTYADAIRLASPSNAIRARIPILGQGGNPMIYIKNSGSVNDVMINVQGNDAVGVFNAVSASSGSQMFDNVSYFSQSSTGYMNIPFYDYQNSAGVGGFGGKMRNTTCSTSESQVGGSTLTPCMSFKYNYLWNIDYMTFNRRGVSIVPFNGMFYDITVGGDAQGLITPMVGISQEVAGTVSGVFKLHNLSPDTSAYPLLANMSPAAGGIGFSVSIDGFGTPSSGGPLVSGKAFSAGLTLFNPVIIAAAEKNLGQNVNTMWVGGNNGNNPGIKIPALRAQLVHYSGSHTLLASEFSVVADANLTFTVDCTIPGAVWTVYSKAGTTTIAPSAACTLSGNGATGSFTLSNNHGTVITVGNQGGEAWSTF